MTQARNYPKTTTTLSTQNFITDDGTTSFTNKIDAIKNAYNFLIGSVVFLNETDPIVYDENEFRKVIYLRYNGTPVIRELISITVNFPPNYICYDNFMAVGVRSGYPDSSGNRFLKSPDLSGSGIDSILVRILESDADSYTFNLKEIPTLFPQVKPVRFPAVQGSTIESYVGEFNIGNNLLEINRSYKASEYLFLTGVLSNVVLDRPGTTGYITSADVTIEQNISLEEIPFGTKNYVVTPGEGLSMEILEEYPALEGRFQQHNINQLSEFGDEGLMLGYTDSFKVINFQEEEHTHKCSTIVTQDGFIQRVVPVPDGERSDWVSGMHTWVRNYFTDMGVYYNSIDNELNPSISTIPAGERTRVNSYSSTPYVIAQIDWK